MGLKVPAEVKMARRILQNHSLSIPFDLDALVAQYAEVIYKTIPLEGVDGICLNLKKPGKFPKVIVNESSPRTRQKFTLAHELGHIIIPWHLGTIVDEIDISNRNTATGKQYRDFEKEANRFASELLMPLDWILSLFHKNHDSSFLILQACEHCGVSEAAAEIRVKNALYEIADYLMPSEFIEKVFKETGDLEFLQGELMEMAPFPPLFIVRHLIQYLPGKIAFCIEKDNIVIDSGATNNTRSYPQFEGTEFQDNPFPHFHNYYSYSFDDMNIHWWFLDVIYDISDDPRSWQEILNKIAIELAPSEGVEKFIRSINGTISGLNGQWKRKNPELGVNDFMEDVIHQFNNNYYIDLFNHPEFLIFAKKRCEALFSKQK